MAQLSRKHSLEYNLIFATILTICFLFPDYLSHLIIVKNVKMIRAKTLLVSSIVSLTITFLNRKVYLATILALLAGLHLAELLHIAYFGTEITPDIILRFFSNPREDFKEIYISAVDAIDRLYKALIIIFFCYGLTYLIAIKLHKNVFKFSYSLALVIVTFAIIPIRILVNSNEKKNYLFYPIFIEPILYNGLNSFFFSALSNSINVQNIHYQPRQIVKTQAIAENIIIIMGESCRDDYMSLFGYHHSTTPLLDRKKYSENFIFKSGISSAVSTAVALPSFFNLMYEPKNLELLNEKTSNILKLATDQGYKVTLISMQSASLLHNIGIKYVDKFISKELMSSEQLEKLQDEILIKELEKIDLTNGRNLIILHQRAIHSPYKNNYKHRPELAIFDENQINSNNNYIERERMYYANAMKFNDYVISHLIDYIDKTLKSAGENYIFFTSDHGELLGENDLFGHNHLNIDNARIPFLIYGVNPSRDFMQIVRDKKLLTHYDFGLLILNRMGVEIINPNFNSNIYYINGNIFSNFGSYLTYNLDEIER